MEEIQENKQAVKIKYKEIALVVVFQNLKTMWKAEEWINKEWRRGLKKAECIGP